MPKKLNEEAIQNELRGGSVFFPPKPSEQQSIGSFDKGISRSPMHPTTEDSSEARIDENKQEMHHDTMVSRHHDQLIEVIRKAVRQQGKEAATYRFTRDEKKALANVVYACRNKDIRTSENEITRIAVNFIIQNHRENKQNSILSRVLERLNE